MPIIITLCFQTISMSSYMHHYLIDFVSLSPLTLQQAQKDTAANIAAAQKVRKDKHNQVGGSCIRMNLY